jgi:hypothetical protein
MWSQCRKCAGAVSVGKWQPPERVDKERLPAAFHFLWAQTLKPVNIHRLMVAVYGAGVMSFQQL